MHLLLEGQAHGAGPKDTHGESMVKLSMNERVNVSGL